MSYAVILANQYDLSELVEEITLEDSLEEIAYRATIRLMVTPDLPLISPGQEIRISGVAYGTKSMSPLLHPGVVWACESSNNGSKHTSLTVYDRTIYLAKSEDELLLPANQTASERLRHYAKNWNIPVGKLPDTSIKLARAVRRSQTIYSMIQADLKETANKGGDMYRPCMTPSGLELLKLGGNSKVWELDLIEETSQSRTLEGAVTQVKVLGQGDDKNLSPVLAIVKGETDKYGTLQKIVQDCDIETPSQARKAAEGMLLGMQESYTLTAPDINVIRAGDRVNLGGLLLFVTNVRHRLGEPGHMELDLSQEAKVRRDYCA